MLFECHNRVDLIASYLIDQLKINKLAFFSISRAQLIVDHVMSDTRNLLINNLCIFSQE